MLLRFGADVQGRDGQVLGMVQRVVYDPATHEVVALVAGVDGEGNAYSSWVGPLARWSNDEVVVPIGAVDTSDPGTVEDYGAVAVELSEEQWKQLDPFVVREQNVAPPPHVDASDIDHIDDPIDVPDVTPVGAATGVESIAFTPIIQDTTNVPEEDQVLDTTTAIWGTDGEIGELHGVNVDTETRLLQAILIGGENVEPDLEIPAENVASVQPGAIVLTLDRASVEAMARG